MTTGAVGVILVLLAPAAAAALTAAPPRIEIDGKTDGTAALSAAVGITAAVGRHRIDATPWLTFDVASRDGLATLLSFKHTTDGTEDATPKPWTAGGTLTLRWWGPDLPGPPAAEEDAARAAAYRTCVAQCKDGTPKDDGGAFCGLRKQYVDEAAADWLEKRTENRPPSEYCDDRKKEMQELARALEQGLVSAETAAKKRADAFVACLAPCAPDSVLPSESRRFCAPYDGPPTEVSPRIFGSTEFCKGGQQLFLNLQKQHPEAVSHHIPVIVNLGGQGGGAKYKHLAPDPASAQQVKVVDTTVHPWSFGASGAWLLSSGGPTWTLEALAVYGFEYQGADDTARYCVPGGNVSQDGGGTVPATICKDVDATAPTRGHRAHAALLLGWFDQVVDSWRVAAGMEVSGQSGERWRKTVEVPIYFQVAGTTTYKGLVRVVPSIAFGGDPKAGTVYAISIALLGQRGFFSEKFDRL